MRRLRVGVALAGRAGLTVHDPLGGAAASIFRPQPLNLETAKALGLAVSAPLLLLADEVIEWRRRDVPGLSGRIPHCGSHDRQVDDSLALANGIQGSGDIA